MGLVRKVDPQSKTITCDFFYIKTETIFIFQAGNVVTGEMVECLILAGADIVKGTFRIKSTKRPLDFSIHVTANLLNE